MKSGINILSLFNGMGTLRQAFENIGVKINKSYSSEIKPFANDLVNYHFPDTIQLGDITNWREWNIDWKEINFIGSGSPCQDLSIANKNREGLLGSRSSLFFVFVDILNHIKSLNKDVMFLQENVYSANKEYIGIMSRELGVYPQMIDSALFTAQNRKRWFWLNFKTKNNMFDIEVDLDIPKDKNIFLKDILTSGIATNKKHTTLNTRTGEGSQEHMINRNNTTGMITLIHDNRKFRVANKIERCRLQGFPDDYCDSISESQAANLLGDGWTLPVIEYILGFIK